MGGWMGGCPDGVTTGAAMVLRDVFSISDLTAFTLGTQTPTQGEGLSLSTPFDGLIASII